MFSENSGSLRLRCNVMVTDARTAVMKQKPLVAELESNVRYARTYARMRFICQFVSVYVSYLLHYPRECLLIFLHLSRLNLHYFNKNLSILIILIHDFRRRTVDDILLAFKATGTLRKSSGDGTALGNGQLASRLHIARSSMDGDGHGTGVGGEFRSKEDRVAEILSRVRTLTKKQDKPNPLSAATATTPLAVSPTAPTSSSRFGNFKHDTGRDSSEEAVWSLVNPMHAAPKGVKGGAQADRGTGGGVIGGKGKAKGEERVAVLKLSRPHRYGNSSGIEEEAEGGSDDGNEKKQDNRGSSSSGRQRLQVEVEGDRGRSLVKGDDDNAGNDADEKAVSRPKRATNYSSKDEIEYFDEKRDDKNDFSDKDRLLDQ